MAMERREDSLLTSPDVTPFGRPQLRQSVMVIRRKMKSIQASDILYFAHPTGVKGKIQRVGCWRRAIPAKNALERQTSRLAHLSNAHLFLGLAVPAFSYPFVYAVHLTQKSI